MKVEAMEGHTVFPPSFRLQTEGQARPLTALEHGSKLQGLSTSLSIQLALEVSWRHLSACDQAQLHLCIKGTESLTREKRGHLVCLQSKLNWTEGGGHWNKECTSRKPQV